MDRDTFIVLAELEHVSQVGLFQWTPFGLHHQRGCTISVRVSVVYPPFMPCLLLLHCCVDGHRAMCLG